MTKKEAQLVEASARIAAGAPKGKEIGFQHTVLCQTSLPHRPTTARTWQREQGNVSLLIEAGRVKRGRQWVEVPLPHGEKPRLLLIHLNSEAVRTGSPVIDAGLTFSTDDMDAMGGPSLLLDADQRGVVRPLDGNGDGSARVDAGSVEAPAVAVTPAPTGGVTPPAKPVVAQPDYTG